MPLRPGNKAEDGARRDAADERCEVNGFDQFVEALHEGVQSIAVTRWSWLAFRKSLFSYGDGGVPPRTVSRSAIAFEKKGGAAESTAR